MGKFSNKWTRAAIPALLLHCSIGTVYCWSIFSQEIADYIGATKAETEWAFSFAIFFLGMSAAVLGKIVEKNIHRSSLIATFCFSGGMALTGVFIMLKSLWGIYLSYGFIMGIGLGTGYLSPVKTLMLWFSDHKGLATGIAVAGFGAAKAIASPIMQALMESPVCEGRLYVMFWILAAVYFCMMFVGHLLLKKPDGHEEPQETRKGESVWAAIKSDPKTFIGIWIMFYINIASGLALISQEKMIIKCIGLAAMAGALSSVTAVFNAAGRFGYSTFADSLKDRSTIYRIIFASEVIMTAAVIFTQGINDQGATAILVVLVLILLFTVNAGYGGGFSNVPTLLADRFGMRHASTVHGLALSAWGIAGLTGNQMAQAIVDNFGTPVEVHGVMANPTGYQTVLYVTVVLYLIAFIICMTLVRPPKAARLAEIKRLDEEYEKEVTSGHAAKQQAEADAAKASASLPEGSEVEIAQRLVTETVSFERPEKHSYVTSPGLA